MAWGKHFIIKTKDITKKYNISLQSQSPPTERLQPPADYQMPRAPTESPRPPTDCKCNGRWDDLDRGGNCTDGKDKKEWQWCYVDQFSCNDAKKYGNNFYSHLACKPCECNKDTDIFGHGGSCGKKGWCIVDNDSNCDEMKKIGNNKWYSKEPCKPPDSGMVQSENYPNNYPNNFTKTYRIDAEDRFLITFLDFNIEPHPSCGYDYLSIKDGDGSVLLPKTCGETKPDPIRSNTNTAEITFRSDDDFAMRGFSIKWKKISTGK